MKSLRRIISLFIFLIILIGCSQSKEELNKELIYASKSLGDVSEDYLKELLKKGADINTKDTNGDTVLNSIAISSLSGNDDYFELIAYILKNYKVNINAQNHDGETALSLIVFFGNIKTIDLLLKNGADVNAKDNDGYTILSNAISSVSPNRVNIVKQLINHGANVNYINSGQSILDIALQEHSQDSSTIELINLLRKHGAKTAKELQAEENTR